MTETKTLKALNTLSEWNMQLEAELFKASWERAMLLVVIERIADKANSGSAKEPDALFQAAIAVSYMDGARGGSNPVTDEEIEFARRMAAMYRRIRHEK